MNKKVKLCLALFMALAVLVQYSFSPQAMVAYGLDNDTGAAQTEETVANDSQEADEQSATEPSAEATEATEAETEAKPAAETAEPTGAKEEAEEEAEDVAYPAQKFSGTAGGVSVAVSAPEGALPEGTTMKVAAVNAGNVQGAVEELIDNGEVVKAVDISFHNKGKEVEPKENVSVRMSSAAFKGLEAASVVHIKDSGAAEMVHSGSVSGKNATFRSDEFSVYAVVEEGSTDENARATVVFKNGDTEIATVYVKNKDSRSELDTILYDPGVGTLEDGETFKGWQISESETASYTVETAPKTIKDVRDYFDGLSITEGDVVYVHAMIFKSYAVSYVAEGVTIENATAFAVGDDPADYTIDMQYAPDDPDQQFQGWYIKPAGNATLADGSAIDEDTAYDNGTKIKLTGPVTLTVKAPKGKWLVFYQNGKGASYTPPQFVERGKTTTEPTDPTRNGYTFKGWYENEACTGQKFTFGNELDESTNLYAKWEPNETAKYTILIWKQRATDAKDASDDAKKYDFAESMSGTGNVGDVIDASEATSKTYNGFHLNSGKTDSDVRITPEGDAIVNVYFDRNLITMTFYTWTGRWTQYTKMEGLYGSRLADNNYTWPNEYNWYDGHNGREATGTRTTFMDAFIPSTPGKTDLSFYGANSNANGYAYFYKKADNGDYVLTNTVRVTTGYQSRFYISDKYNGYKAVSYKIGRNGTLHSLGEPDENGYYETVNLTGNLYVYYDPLQYNILFKDGVFVDGDGNAVPGYESSTVLKEVEDINYQSDISSYNKGGANYYEPTNAEGFVFDGWYIDDACTTPYTFTTMPEGLTVYAKWRLTQYRVFLHPNADGDNTYEIGANQSTSFRVNQGAKVNSVTVVRDEYELIGWYIDPDFKTSFNFDAYALQDSTPGMHDYDKSRPTELDKYGNKISDENADTERGWITKCLDLYANWRSKLIGADGITVEYDANGGSNAPTDSLLYKDKSNAVAQAASTPGSDNEQFNYWVVQKWNGTEFVDTNINVYPGDTFQVLKDNSQITDEDGNVVPPSQLDKTKKYTYTIKLRAEYGQKEAPTPTHISWYSNYGTENDGKGKLYQTENLQINEATDILGAQTREGYEFMGWTKTKGGTTADFLVYTGSGYTHNSTAVTQVAADEVEPYDDMYAVWKEANVTIKYVSEDTTMGTVDPAEETVAAVSGTAKGSTATPASDDYEFVNWTDKDGKVVGTNAKFVPEKVNGKNVAATYTAHFKEKEVEIKYVSADTTMGTVDPAKEKVAVSSGTAKGSKATPKSDDYEFVNWTDKDGKVVSTEATFVPQKVDGKNVAATYTANFKEKEVTIEYVSADETMGTVDPAEETVAVVSGTAKGSKATPKSDDYEFVNWTDKDGTVVGTNATFVPEKVDGKNVAATYTANFKEKEAVIKYVSADETMGTVDPAKETVAVVSGTAEGSKATPASDKYEFVSWTNKNGEVVSTDAAFVPEKVGGKNVAATYTANFKQVKAEITYVLNGGTYNGSTADIVETHEIGEEITIHEAPTREGYVFQYWEGSRYDPGDKYTVTGDHTFTAVWEATGTDDTDDDADNAKDKSSSETKTGDRTSLLGTLAVMTAALLGILGLAVTRRREEEDK